MSFDIDLERGMPANLDAERTILGSILLENAHYYTAANLDGRFALTAHNRAFKQMGELAKAGRAVDIVTLSEELARTKEIESVGGVAWIASLTEGLPRRLNIDEYVRIVHDKWAARKVITILSGGIARVADQSEPSADVIASIDGELLNVTAGVETERTVKEQGAEVMANLEKMRSGQIDAGVGTGIKHLDSLIGGYRRRKLYVIGGRPSMGKSSLLVEAAIQHCVRKIRTRIVSLEMDAEEMLQRIYAAVAEIPFERVIDPAIMSESEWRILQGARTIVDGWPLEIDSRAGQTIDSALAGCRLSCRRRGTGFVGLDYLQILRFVQDQKLRYQELSDAAARMREFAKTENIPVMLLSSITETGDRNPNQRPTLANLRGSGDLGFHADAAILIHRERAEDGATILPDGELIVAKQRGGRTGVALTTYNTRSLLFDDRENQSNG